MKVDFYTYNQPIKQYNYPSFMAKPIKVDWNGEAGQRILYSLQWLAATAMTAVAVYNSKDKSEFDEETQGVMKEFVGPDVNEESMLNDNVGALNYYYQKTNDSDIIQKHAYLLRDAYLNRDLLKGGFSELGDYELFSQLLSEPVVTSLGLLGKGALESAFNLDLDGFENLCKDVLNFSNIISKNNLELLREKINPETCLKYRNIEEKVAKDKRQINKLLGKENRAKRKQLTEQIEILKSENCDKKEIKELKKQIQKLYMDCENAEQIKELMQGINEKQRKMKEIVNNKVKLSPQEIINKVWTIAAISKSPKYIKRVIVPDEDLAKAQEFFENFGGKNENGSYVIDKMDYAYVLDNEDIPYYIEYNKAKLNKDMKELIELIQEPSEENDKLWNKNIDKKIYERAGLLYNEDFANLLNLADCKYLNELITSDNAFWQVFPHFLDMLQSVINYFECGIDEGLDAYIFNWDTKLMFKERNINYDKWVHYDKDSYISGGITLLAKDAKDKAVKNMIFDIATLFSSEILPQEEKDSFLNAISECGASVIKKGKNITVEIDGKPIQYSDLANIMAAVKKEFNTNPFWSVDIKNEGVYNLRDTLYNHFMIQRKQEIVSAKNLKEQEEVNIKVQKVNMSDIKYSLCLGNHSHCCTALGSQANEWSAISYILNRCISAIEVVANGEPVGNTMMYLADVNGELSLVLDDIELQTKFQNNDQIKDMIIKYAKQVCKEIGKPDIPIYAGPGMQKVDITDLKKINAKMEIIGKSYEDMGVYLDYDAEMHDIGNVIIETELYKIT